jgi:hypothetical protein
VRFAAGLVAILILSLLWHWWTRRYPVSATEIYQGVIYGCEHLDQNKNGYDLVHWVKVDLSAPGVQLYVTPLDPRALAQGWQYRLQSTASVVRRENLAVGINACLFKSQSWVPLSGDLARSVETAISDHVVNHVWEHTYLLWFDDDLIPRQELVKPPSEQALERARWGVGGQGVGLKNGRVRLGSDTDQLDSRTAIGIDSDRNLLILAVFESATPSQALEKLAELGAKEGMLLDGGDSTSMALGSDTAGVRSGTTLNGWRPWVATHFGVRANPLGGR